MKNISYIPGIVTLILYITVNLSAQQEIVFIPADLIPHDEGYYYTGVDVDENKDGVMEHHDGCDDYYEDGDLTDGYNPQMNHAETGKQQGFNYQNCMIMPDCAPKGTAIDPPVTNGYIQIAPNVYSGTDSASYSYLLSPTIKNLVSLTLEASSDVSINDKRQIPFNIDCSKDNGNSWETYYISDFVDNQGGYRVTYDATTHLEFKEMTEASKTNGIVLRITTNDFGIEGPTKGQYVKIHSISIVGEKDEVGIDHLLENEKFIINQNEILSLSENLKVFNTLGQKIGEGKKVTVEKEGLYIIYSENKIFKVFIK